MTTNSYFNTHNKLYIQSTANKTDINFMFLLWISTINTQKGCNQQKLSLHTIDNCVCTGAGAAIIKGYYFSYSEQHFRTETIL